jgi:hypothetical protein
MCLDAYHSSNVQDEPRVSQQKRAKRAEAVARVGSILWLDVRIVCVMEISNSSISSIMAPICCHDKLVRWG